MNEKNLIKVVKQYYLKKYDEIYNPRAVKAALYYSKIYGFDCGDKSTYNNEADAFKHTFASALVSLEEGNIISYIGGRYHEWSNSSNNAGEYNMDIHNNKIGRNIAGEIRRDYRDKWNIFTSNTKDEIIAERVWQKMQEGKLILDPSGRRRLKDNNKGLNVTHTKNGCVGSYPVSGYTRSDGIEVSGYVRRCGAKHMGYKESIMQKYKGRKLSSMSDEEIDEFLEGYYS